MKPGGQDLPSTLRIGGIPVARMTRMDMALLMEKDCIEARGGCRPRLPRLAFGANGQLIQKYHADREFRHCLEQAEVIDADGMSLVFASRLFYRTPLPERTNNSDFIVEFSEVAVRSGLRLYLLGSTNEINRAACEFLRERFPGLTIVGRHHGYFEPSEESALCSEIVGCGTEVLWVGLGCPRQEFFSVRNRDRLLGVVWIRNCGGTFDQFAGRVGRAPLWMQQSGLEWLFRLLEEPRRLGPRYLATNLPALYHLATKTGGEPAGGSDQ